MDDITRKVLVSTKAFLERLTKAEVLNPDQLTEAHMAVTALGYQLARASYDPAALAHAHEQERALVSELGDILDKRASAPVNRVWKERWGKGVGAQLTALVADTGASSRETSEKTERDVAQKLRDFLVGYHEPMDPTVSAGTKTTYQGGRGDRQEPEAEKNIYITAPLLQQYLHARFPDMAATTVSEVKRLMGGYSKETYIVRFQEANEERRFVIRKDGYGLPTGSSVANEFAVLKEVHAAGVPVPEPLWLEADTSHFGAAYMAVGFAVGQPAHLNVPSDAGSRQKWAEELARTVALLHQTTSKPDLDVRDQIRADIADLQRRVEEREREPHPGLAFGLSWLTDHIDDLEGRPACRIHGDIGFHNILMEKDRIVALLDWEFSHYSDPIEDLVYVKPFLDQLEQWPNFLRVYQQECGFGFDEKAARYFDVWKEARNMIACLGSLNSLLLPSVKDVALSVAGTIYIPKYEIAVLDTIINGDSPNV